jgi:hypothetical protein
MLEPALFLLISFLLVMLLVYLWASQRNLIKIRALTPQEYLWKLKQITGKSEYELFHIAAEEKGWPEYQVERHFKRYLENQTLPEYLKEFLEDGKEYINAYRPGSGNFLDKRLYIFYSLFAFLVIGFSFFFCLHIYPRIAPIDHLPEITIAEAIEANPRLAKPFINRAISYVEKGRIEKGCSYLNLACELGYCEEYYQRYREGVCL